MPGVHSREQTLWVLGQAGGPAVLTTGPGSAPWPPRLYFPKALRSLARPEVTELHLLDHSSGSSL